MKAVGHITVQLAQTGEQAGGIFFTDFIKDEQAASFGLHQIGVAQFAQALRDNHLLFADAFGDGRDTGSAVNIEIFKDAKPQGMSNVTYPRAAFS